MPGAGLGVDELAAAALHTEHLLLVPVLVPGENVKGGVHVAGHLRQDLQIRVRFELVRQELLSVKSLHKLEPGVAVRDGPDDLVLLHPAEVISHLPPDLSLHVVHLLVTLPLDGQLVLVPQHEHSLPLVVPLQRRVADEEQLLHELPQPPVLPTAGLLATPTAGLLTLEQFGRVVHAVLEYYLSRRVLG